MTKRPLHPEARKRKARIRKIMRENFQVRRLGRGRYSVTLKIDHQYFQLNDDGFYSSRRETDWTTRMGAIALHRFKFGD